MATATSLKPFSDLLNASVESYKQNIKSVMVVSAIAAAGWLPYGLFSNIANAPAGEMPPFMLADWLMLLLYGLVSVFVTIALLYVADGRHKTAGLSGLLKLSAGKFVPVFLVSLLAGLAVLGGVVLLLIPAIIFAVWFVFVQQVVMFEDQGIVAAMKQSRAYVRGQWWAIFGRVLVIIILLVAMSMMLSLILSIAGSLAPALTELVSIFVLTPIATIFSYHLYRSAVAAHTAAKA